MRAKSLSKKIFICCSAIVMSMGMVTTSAFAYDTVGKSVENFTSSDGIYYYDIDGGKTKDRMDVTDTTALLKAALLRNKDGKTSGETSTNIRDWGELAYCIFGTNSRVYFSPYDESGIGDNKKAKDFKKRFSADVQKKEDFYGDLRKLLASESSGKQESGDGIKHRGNDINTTYTGLQSASNLNEVQNAAAQSLADLNEGKVTRDDFLKYNSLKGMADDNKSSSPVLYTFLTTRDRYGVSFHYAYNCLGMVFHDFNLEPVSGPEGEGVNTALKGYDSMKEAIDKTEKGEQINGFNYSANAKAAATDVTNKSDQDMSQQLTMAWSENDNVSNTISSNSSITSTQTVNAKFTFGKPEVFFHAEVGLEVSESELIENGKATTNSVTKEENGSNTQSVTVPAHTVVTQNMKTENQIIKEKYDCPVAITYKVTFFSMCGEYYDDNAATQAFKTAQYQQRSFMSTFGNSGESAVPSLKNRAVTNVSDVGYDRTKGVTRGIAIKHGTSDPTMTWDSPWVDHIGWNSVKNGYNELCAKDGDSEGKQYDRFIKEISGRIPMSVSGGVLERQARRVSGEISGAVPIYPLKRVVLTDSKQTKLSIAKDDTYILDNIELAGKDSESANFYGFKASKGSWKVVDDNGKEIDSDILKISKDENGFNVATAKKTGKVKIKYFVDDDVYKIADGTKIKGKDVAGSQVNVTVVEDASKATKKEKSVKTKKASEKPVAVSKKEIKKCSIKEESFGEALIDMNKQLCDFAEKSEGKKIDIAEDLDTGFSGDDFFVELRRYLGKDKKFIAEWTAVAQDRTEREALLWAMKHNLLEDIEADSISTDHGINEEEFAVIAYGIAKDAGLNVKTDKDYLKDYDNNVAKTHRKAINWAISKGMITKKEKAAKHINLERIVNYKYTQKNFPKVFE